jgi:ribonuclease R
VRIQVSRVDLDGRKIDFRLVNEDEGGNSNGNGRASGDKLGGRDAKVRLPLAERFDVEVGGGRSASFKAEPRKRGAAKSGRAAKASPAKSSERSSASSKKAARKKR